MEFCFERSTYIMLRSIFRGKKYFCYNKGKRRVGDRAWIKVVKFYIYNFKLFVPYVVLYGLFAMYMYRRNRMDGGYSLIAVS